MAKIIEPDFGDIRALAVSQLKAAAVSEAKVSAVTRKAASDVQTAAKIFAPVDTGYMRSNISTKILSATEAEVTSSANYSVYVEYGTRKMAANPFMKPAAEYVAPRFEAALGTVAEQVMES